MTTEPALGPSLTPKTAWPSFEPGAKLGKDNALILIFCRTNPIQSVIFIALGVGLGKFGGRNVSGRTLCQPMLA